MFERLAGYNILGVLGAGGLGELYRARDTRHGRTVALRVVSPEIRDAADRRASFLRDAERAAALSHPNIVTLYEIGEDEGQLFAAFEFVPGDSLKSLIAAGPINPRRAVQAAAQIADALAEGHARGMTHGAIDGDHVVITPRGNVKVLDFGLIPWSDRAATLPGETPEPKDDLSALGVLLQDMARGASPSGARRVVAEIDRIVAKTLCDDPDERYDSAATLAADLRAVDAILAQRAAPSETREAVPPQVTAGSRPYTRQIAALLVAVVVVSGAAWAARDRLTSTWRRAVASPRRPVVAVMPFEQPDGSRTYLSIGIAQDLAARLGQTPGVQVVARTGTRRPGTTGVDLARQLNAGVVLGGTVRPAGGPVELSVRLIDPSTSDVIWHGEYRRELKDIFSLQSQIADDVARAIGVVVTPSAAGERAAARLVDPAAYDAYLRGQQAAGEGQIGDAERLLTQAVQLDDGLAEAHASLAAVLYEVASLNGPGADSVRQRATRAAERAVELAPDLPAANVAAGITAASLPDALGALKSAIRYDPSYADAYREIGDQIGDFDPDRAAKFRHKAVALDPALGSDAAGRAEWPPDSCEAVVVSSAPSSNHRVAESARQRMAAALESGSAATAGPHAVRCAALSAAALGNAAAASALLRRIASNEPALRVWSTHTGGLTGSSAFRGGVFPWSRVEDNGSFSAATRALEDAYVRARRQIAAALDDITP